MLIETENCALAKFVIEVVSSIYGKENWTFFKDLAVVFNKDAVYFIKFTKDSSYLDFIRVKAVKKYFELTAHNADKDVLYKRRFLYKGYDSDFLKAVAGEIREAVNESVFLKAVAGRN